GSHDDGQGEAEDVVFLASWLLDRSQQLLLGGYSFGALVALQAMPDIAYHKAVLVAPPVEMVHVPPQALEPPPAPTEDTLVILGDQDQFVSADKAEEFFAGDSVRIHRIAAADHFFADSADEIIRQVTDFVRDE
ncbi:MAG: alpha/beta hydrolase, partial [Pseudomonadales bacterium]